MNKGLKLDILCYSILLGITHLSGVPEAALIAVAISALYGTAVMVTMYRRRKKMQLEYIISHC